MANLFVNLPVPATPGVGAPVLVAGIGPEKSFVIDGPMKADPSLRDQRGFYRLRYPITA